MKNKTLKFLSVLIGAALAAVLLSGCTITFDKYDDGEYIKTASSNNSYLSVQTTTNEGIKWEVKSFGGVKTLKNNVALEDDALLDITLEYIGGRFKIVAISDGMLYTLIENDSCSELSTQLKKGTYTIKAVGDNAELKIRYKLQ